MKVFLMKTRQYFDMLVRKHFNIMILCMSVYLPFNLYMYIKISYPFLRIALSATYKVSCFSFFFPLFSHSFKTSDSKRMVIALRMLNIHCQKTFYFHLSFYLGSDASQNLLSSLSCSQNADMQFLLQSSLF